MKLSNALKKLAKAGMEVEHDGVFYRVRHNGQVLEFGTQNGELICISTRNKNDVPDSMTDYFPQTWHDNLTQAIKFINRQ